MKTPFERLFQTMTRPWVMGMYVLITVLSFIYWDKPIAEAVHALDLSAFVMVLKSITFLGVKTLYLIGLPVLALVFRYVMKHKSWAFRTWFLWLCVFIPDAVTFVLKIIFGRARPEL